MDLNSQIEVINKDNSRILLIPEDIFQQKIDFLEGRRPVMNGTKFSYRRDKKKVVRPGFSKLTLSCEDTEALDELTSDLCWYDPEEE